MKVRTPGHSRSFIYGLFAVLALYVHPARAELLTAALTCTLAGPTSISCDPSFSYGTVTLDDFDGGGPLTLTVDLTGVGGKFRNLMLNFEGPPGSAVWSLDSQASLSYNGYSLAPYVGEFDIGGSGSRGWHSDSSFYTTQLLSNLGTSLVPGNFDVMDSLEQVSLALHIQDLTSTGDSIKVGGIWEGGGPPEEVPEPATCALVGGGLILLAWVARRRKPA